jgi:hypothetical protein
MSNPLPYRSNDCPPPSTRPPIQWLPEDLSPGVRRPGRETDHSSPSTVETKTAWNYTSTKHFPVLYEGESKSFRTESQ